jgi:hypothetical protein
VKEVAYVAFHFHWSRNEVLELAHAERRLWVEQIGTINDAMNRGDSG